MYAQDSLRHTLARLYPFLQNPKPNTETIARVQF